MPKVPGLWSRYTVLFLVATLTTACDIGVDGLSDDDLFEEGPCDAVWGEVFDECMLECIGFGCLEYLSICTAEANREFAYCCRALDMEPVFEPERTCLPAA